MRLPTAKAIGLMAMFVASVSLADAQAVKGLNFEKLPDVVVGSCAGQSASSAVDAQATASVLADYGFDLKDGLWACSTLRTAWLENGNIFLLRTISVQVDSEKRLTILSFEHEPRLWVIPISAGMVNYPNLADEIHNRAAFNYVVAENKIWPQSPEMWVSLALLYLNLVGIETHVADWKAHGESVHGQESSAEFFKKKSLRPSVECQNDHCDITINDTRTTSVTQSVTSWVLTFSTKNHKVLLVTVEHDVKALSDFQ